MTFDIEVDRALVASLEGAYCPVNLSRWSAALDKIQEQHLEMTTAVDYIIELEADSDAALRAERDFLDQENMKLRDLVDSLLNKVNCVTAPWRHQDGVNGNEIDALCDRQIEIEQRFAELKRGRVHIKTKVPCNLPIATDSALNYDRDMLGTAFKYTCRCGQAHRLEPERVVIYRSNF